MAATDLSDLAHDLLDSLAIRLAAAGVEVPGRQYVWFGNVAVDCDQLVVAFEQYFRGLPAQANALPIDCIVLRTAQLAIYLIRCVPSGDDKGNPPLEAAMDDAGVAAMVDAHVLMRAAVQGFREDWGRTCDSVGITGMTTVGPSGGYGGVILRLQVQT